MNFIILYGPPAAGKLTVGRELASILNYRLLDNHAIIDPVAQIFPFEDPVLNKVRSDLSRRFRVELFTEAAKYNVNCITTCAHGMPAGFDFMRAMQKGVEDAGGNVFFVQLIPTIKALHERVESDSRAQKINSSHKLHAMLEEQPSFLEELPGIDHLKIDNSDLSPPEVARIIINHYKLEKTHA